MRSSRRNALLALALAAAAWALTLTLVILAIWLLSGPSSGGLAARWSG